MSETNSQVPVVDFPNQKSTVISDELSRILDMLRDICPAGARISFDFDGKLHVHIDVRTGEDVARMGGILPTLGGGMFHGINVGTTPHHPFFHRVSALIDR